MHKDAKEIAKLIVHNILLRIDEDLIRFWGPCPNCQDHDRVSKINFECGWGWGASNACSR